MDQWVVLFARSSSGSRVKASCNVSDSSWSALPFLAATCTIERSSNASQPCRFELRQYPGFALRHACTRYVVDSTEVVFVTRLLEPPPLAVRFAGIATRSLPAVPLPTAIARVDIEELSAMLALARSTRMHRRPASLLPQPSTIPPICVPAPSLPQGRKTTHRSRPLLLLTGRRSTEEKVDSYPPVYDDFLLAADRAVPPSPLESHFFDGPTHALRS